MKTAITIFLMFVNFFMSIGFGLGIYRGIGSVCLSTFGGFILFLLLTVLIANLTIKKS